MVVANSSGQIEYDPGLTKIEASQKGWLLTRALAELLYTITCVEATPDDRKTVSNSRQVNPNHLTIVANHDWLAYYTAKKKAIDMLKQFEVWHGMA